MTSTPAHTVGSVMPAADSAPPQPDSLWRAWTEPHAYAVGFRTARSALAALLAQRGVKRVWLPTFVCGEVAAAASAGGREIVWAAVDSALRIDPSVYSAARVGDAILAVDYFGRSPDAEFRAYARSHAGPDSLWIEDRAHALAPDAPPWGQVLLYSPRKLVGVGDGGLLVGDAPLPLPDPVHIGDEAALWAPEDAKALDPQGLDPSTWFPRFRQREAAFGIDHLPISPRSREALHRVSARGVSVRRRGNYRVLLDALGDYALWPDVSPTFAPLAFPVRVKDRDTVVARLGERGVFCARHWSALPCPRDGFDAAWALAGDILSIPCDHRYDAEDMFRVIDALKAVARPA